MQVGDNFLRITEDHVLEEMVKKLGAKVSHVEAPFEPEAGAYGGGIEYTRIGSGWRMTATQGPVQLTLSSRDALATFIGRSFEVIARRAQ